MTAGIHPEVMPSVLKEFRKLHQNHPTVDGKIKWAWAVDYVRTICFADTHLLDILIHEEIDA